ncbi:phytoene/squalene synthase family protein [Persicimonas caeni]|uniref:Phytoene/squalene synthase family protein n=1 Tax=Persicimonas caeni TaxID=2292766 RepID=A0A4Y6PSA9_PERCE|nr:phytoene/squalene synthase family protein [Persicimonas caeni]QDG51222.1 phytoene/squalene synthase family protein [Persicimonas caeni]QED32443.1 phytoene/squalene synthase family protein [Persicimonas caeni]
MSGSTDMVVASREVLAVNSRSFSWASWFLPADRRDDAAVVYALCRLIDDIADESDSAEQARAELKLLRGELEGERDARALVAVFLDVAERRKLDVVYALELIAGVESDLGKVCLRSDRDLLRYCYRVAGTVGLMMCAVLGVDDQRAHAHAIDLGVAMQLTNICRDVLEDAERGRVYLPAKRLRDAGVEPRELLAGEADPEKVSQVVCDLLKLADRYYRSADCGMAYIPARSRLAIVVAARIYRAIGVKLLQNDGDALAGRTIVSGTMKLWWVMVALSVYCSPTIMGVVPADGHDKSLHTALEGLPGV